MQTSKENNDDLIQLVSFNLGQEEFGVEILMVQEINRIVNITRVPGAPHYCEGVINLRGNVIQVIDLRKKFGMDVDEWTKSTRIIVCDVDGVVIGMIVDSVQEVRRIPSSTIESTVNVISSVNTTYISGVVKIDDRLLIFLDIAKVAGELSSEVSSDMIEQVLQ